MRYRFYEALPDHSKAFTKVEQMVVDTLAQPSHAHLTDEDRSNINAKVEVARTYLAKVEQDLGAKNKWEEPGYTTETISNVISVCQAECLTILNKPVPKAEVPKEAEKIPEAEASE